MLDPMQAMLARAAMRGMAVRQVPEAPPPPPTRLQQKMAVAQSEDGPHVQYAEILRVCDLPVTHPMTLAEVREYSRMNVLAEAFARGFVLYPTQAEALYAYESIRGGFFPIGVGWGKTLISLMIAHKAYNRGIRSEMLFVPSQVYIQLTTVDIKWARHRVPIGYPIHLLGGRTRTARQDLAKSGKHGLYIMPYSLLSAPDAEEILYTIRPELIILDECHEVSNRSAARTQRLMRYMHDWKPEVVAESGTITHKSLMDYHHLIRFALRGNCPVPHAVTLAAEWAAIIDAQATNVDNPDGSTNSGPLLPLVKWAKHHFPAEKIDENVMGFRKAYRLRLSHTLGVVSSGDAEIGTSLTIALRNVADAETRPGWKDLQAHLSRVDLEWVTPNGDELEHAIHKWKWLYELSAGFYNQLTWPTEDAYARRRSIPLGQATEVLTKAQDHHEAGQEYAKALRAWIQDRGRQGLDTPMLIGMEMSRNGAKTVGAELYDLWVRWKSLDFEGRPERDRTAVRVCDFKIKAAVEWCFGLPRGEGGLLWVYHQEMGRWLYEAMVASGIDAMHCPAGDQFNAAILDQANANRMIVASIEAHGTGKNLQHFKNQLVVQWPRPAKDAEQMLGRTHRNGQKADSLVVDILAHSEFDSLNFAACLNDALYIHQTTGNRQKLIYAGYDPLPKIFPSSVLQERGLEAKLLTAEQQTILQERFGGKP